MPYRSIQHMIMPKYVAYENREEEGNPFGWSEVRYNLLGTGEYDSTLPWVMKVQPDGHLASEIYCHVDDG